MSALWKKTTIIATAIVALGGAWAVLANDLRWWAWRSDVAALAENSYDNSERYYNDKLISIELLIKQCILRPDCSDVELVSLKKLKTETERQLKRVKDERKKIN